MRTIGLLSVTVLLAGACGGGSDPVDFSGEYSISLTNRENGCGFMNWVEDDTAVGVPVTVTQAEGETQVTATVNGGAGLYLDLILGSRVFTGEADGPRIDLTLYGTNSATMGQCTYTVNANLFGRLEGDVLTGDITYTTATNGSPECGTLEGCESRQDFNGTRPPTN
jgi:FlaG/FlaF family flagellin (archaellin)